MRKQVNCEVPPAWYSSGISGLRSYKSIIMNASLKKYSWIVVILIILIIQVICTRIKDDGVKRDPFRGVEDVFD